MQWPPKVGDLLPRAADAWYEQRKLKWILGEEGHGREWERVFHVGISDRDQVWTAITESTTRSKIRFVRDRAPFGIACGVTVNLMMNGRMATVIVSWHYAFEGDAPRLVTAFPIP
jgi:hypothetical protein